LERRPSQRYRWPCCGYVTLESRSAFDTCPVCLWEDNEADEEFGQSVPERPEGPNHVHLWQARRTYATFGASEERLQRFVRAPRPEETSS
jgi:hypothetical protein